MAAKGEFQLFMPYLMKLLLERHPFMRRFDEAFCTSMPKSCSINCGISPRVGKYFVLEFQHSSKPWSVGEFTINIHISDELKPTSNWLARYSQYKSFEEGYYRLSMCVESNDRWWCLKDEATEFIGHRTSASRPFVEPSSYADRNKVFLEIANSVEEYLATHVLRPAGFIA